MCGRITLTVRDLETVAQLLGADVNPGDASLYCPHYNLGPTSQHWMVTAGPTRRLVPALWGMRTKGEKLVINARAETLGARPLFREAVARRRCIIPTDGFFEWSGPRSDRRP